MNLGPHAGFIVAAYGVAAAGRRRADRLGRARPSRAAAQARRPRGARRDAPLRPQASRRPHDARPRTSRTPRRRRRLLVLLPLLLFLALAALFLFRLGAGDPSKLPSALIGRPVPATPICRRSRASCATARRCPASTAADFKGAVTLVNVWASWCVPCHDEAPLLMTARRGQAHPPRRHQLQGPARQRAPLHRPLRQSVRGGRRRRQRPRLDRLGRLRRAGDLRGRPRRPHRLQAGRADHAGQSGDGAQARDREGAGGCAVAVCLDATRRYGT